MLSDNDMVEYCTKHGTNHFGVCPFCIDDMRPCLDVEKEFENLLQLERISS
ncbi:hypothetical protein LCGC14_2122120 [marine sediment metagenome]|uniref:Uncharacterized protein n=1 Tax=marine sediment metagenome TaxID=412755 RepID=A0A0F9E3Z7_9ZZZZ